MHEMSLMESVIEIAEETAARHGAKRVSRIVLEVGQLSHVDPEALLFCHEAVRAGTLADGAALDIIRVAGEGWCLDCGKIVALAERFGACPDCGRHHVQMTAGDDLRIKEMEVD